MGHLRGKQGEDWNKELQQRGFRRNKIVSGKKEKLVKIVSSAKLSGVNFFLFDYCLNVSK